MGWDFPSVVAVVLIVGVPVPLVYWGWNTKRPLERWKFVTVSVLLILAKIGANDVPGSLGLSLFFLFSFGYWQYLFGRRLHDMGTSKPVTVIMAAASLLILPGIIALLWPSSRKILRFSTSARSSPVAGIEHELKRQFIAADYWKVLELADALEENNQFSPELLVVRATSLQQLGWHKDAIDDYSSALINDPYDCNVYFQRALSFIQLGQVAEYEADMAEAIRMASMGFETNRPYETGVQKQGYASLADFLEQQWEMNRNLPAYLIEKRQADARLKARRADTFYQEELAS